MLSWIKKRQKWILDIIALGAVLQYCAYRFLQSTMFTFYYSNTYKMITMGLLLVFGGIRYLYIVAGKLKEKNVKERKKFILYCIVAWLLTIPFLYVGWKHDYKALIFLPICCMCLYDMEAEKVLKSFAFTIGILLAATVLCSLAGTVRNLVKADENGRIVASYGIINTTDFASYFTFLLLAIWCGLRRREWYISVLFAIISAVISYIVFLLTESRTVITCGVLIVVLSLLEGIILRNRRWKVADVISVAAFPVIGFVVVILTVFYAQQSPWATQINTILSGRLEDTLVPYQTYGIHSFGTVIESMHGRGGTLLSYDWSSGYGYIDVAYAMLAIRYGWVITAIVTGLWIWMTVRAVKYGNTRVALTMAILAFHALSEARVWDVNYNIFLIMPFCMLRTPVEDKKAIEKKAVWSAVIPMIATGGVFLLFLPRMLSWLRTFFSYNGWNSGTAAFRSLLVCIGIAGFVVLLWCSIRRLIRKTSISTGALFASVLLLGITGTLAVNSEIKQDLSYQAERLDKEESAIRTVQGTASQPVYAAESEELYNRRFGSFANHIFSTEELSKGHEGSIFTDAGVEAQGLTVTGSLYTQISASTGLYSYDPEVIRALAKAGYEWTPYYSGNRRGNLSDIAVFNGLKTVKDLSGPLRIITSNMETDQFSGKYEVTFELSGLTESIKQPVAVLEVLGETGETEILQKELLAEDFDTDGHCSYTIDYTISSTPKVSYAVTISENIHLSIDSISWKRKLQECSSGAEIYPDGKVIMSTDVPDNRFGLLHFQIFRASTEQYLLSFGEGDSAGGISGEYIHNLPSDLYYVRLKGNSNLADEWIQTLMYIEEGSALYYNYDIEELSPDRIVVSNIMIDKAD